MFRSTRQNARFEDCGHFIHDDCLDKLICQWSSYLCPLCLKSQRISAGKAWERFDEAIESMPLPADKRSKTRVFCYDCCICSQSDFHPLGVKCLSCYGYNTCQL
eukprot:TRINITY_DN35404_c0_g1_i1.p4 TRINITY_DN35404_c0_g1~~TRINITY_DN35404_c0_g1_i1.p4  ORF type:complete len:104 (-),score=2.89 TRINITY_DN35404_c0_g1_i1:410-721(-)